MVGGKSWHSKFNWDSRAYFDDPKVVKFCNAIESNDLEQMRRLIEGGVDVNSLGKGNMTPLLWAFPDNQLGRFTLLLEKGADPNVVVQSDFNTRGTIRNGHSVTMLSAMSAFPGYFSAVMAHGGDPALVDRQSGESLLHAIIKSPASREEKTERIRLLVKKRVNLDHLGSRDQTPAMLAVGWGGQYEIALLLVKSGADPCADLERSNMRLVHFVAKEEKVQRPTSPAAAAALKELVAILEDHGESLEAARSDLKRWAERTKVLPPKKVRELREKEVAERIEQQKAKAKVKAED